MMGRSSTTDMSVSCVPGEQAETNVTKVLLVFLYKVPKPFETAFIIISTPLGRLSRWNFVSFIDVESCTFGQQSCANPFHPICHCLCGRCTYPPRSCAIRFRQLICYLWVNTHDCLVPRLHIRELARISWCSRVSRWSPPPEMVRVRNRLQWEADFEKSLDPRLLYNTRVQGIKMKKACYPQSKGNTAVIPIDGICVWPSRKLPALSCKVFLLGLQLENWKLLWFTMKSILHCKGRGSTLCNARSPPPPQR